MFQIRKMTYDEVFQKFGPRGFPPLYKEPIVVVVHDGDTTNDEASTTLSPSSRNARFRDLTRQETILNNFPENFNVILSSSNSLSEHRRTTTLAQYINETVEKFETLPDQPANVSWYLFGETYTDDWRSLLEKYELPPCSTCTPDLVALSFGIGNRGSGVQWHVHGPGTNGNNGSLPMEERQDVMR